MFYWKIILIGDEFRIVFLVLISSSILLVFLTFPILPNYKNITLMYANFHSLNDICNIHQLCKLYNLKSELDFQNFQKSGESFHTLKF